jgi:hypothetical protein
MQPILPLSADTLLLGFAHTDQSFEFVRAHATVEAAGRPYTLVEGLLTDLISGEVFQVHAVATPESVAGGWRIALLTQYGYTAGYNFLKNMKEAPTFVLPSTAAHKSAATAIRCKEKGGNLYVCQVLAPYQMPINSGGLIEGGVIDAVGTPVFFGDNESAMVPVHLLGGTYALAFCQQQRLTFFKNGNTEVMRLITTSSKMPEFREGIGVGVWHVVVYEGESLVLIKLYYNQKAGRPAEIHR